MWAQARALGLFVTCLLAVPWHTGSTGNVLSFSETRAHQAVQQKAEQFMLYNQRQLTRVYPSAYRIDSSNFNPVPYWNVGCQLGRSCIKHLLPFGVCVKKYHLY